MKTPYILKRLFSLVICVVFFSVITTAYAASGSTTVYVTRTGEKYHTAGCSYLKSSIAISLEDAVDSGYTRCSRCNPPKLDETSSSTYSSYVYSTPKPTYKPTTTQKPYSTPIPTATHKPYSTPTPTTRPAMSTASHQDDNALAIGAAILFGFATVTLLVVQGGMKKEINALRSDASCAYYERSILNDKVARQNSNIDNLSSEISLLKASNSVLLAQKNTLSEVNNRLKDENQMLTLKLKRKAREIDVLRAQKGVECLSDTNINALCHVPHGAYIGEDGLPAGHGDRKWGQYFTFYRTADGSRYHDNFRCSGATIPVNVINVANLKPCERCKPVLPDLNWYYNLKMMQELRQQISNTE